MNRLKEVISLLEMMAGNNLAGIDEGIKIRHESYMKGKGDALMEIIPILKQIETEESSYNTLLEMMNAFVGGFSDEHSA